MISEDFIEIPEKKLAKWKGKLVHVKGWNKGCVFTYEKTVDGVHHLRTPKTGKSFVTREALMYTRRKEYLA